jgi:hypothetical protein
VVHKSVPKQAAELIMQIVFVEEARGGAPVRLRAVNESFCRLGWLDSDFDAGLTWAREQQLLSKLGEQLRLTPKGAMSDLFSHLAPRREQHLRQIP